jgi:hypothetical protein
MSNKTEKKAGADESKMIDPTATSPSKDPQRKDRQDTSTATEPNSKQRIANKVSRTGRGNGGGDEVRRGGLNMDLTPDTLGEREGVSPAETDLIWTNQSKDRWGADQPDMGKLLGQRNEIEKQRREREEA